ncbi:MAG: hypothetical protein KDL87_11705, partial [Verrucomicrobiae bacterium]|nr:hypothetical protein [Verrucomicrobiae bacterium]
MAGVLAAPIPVPPSEDVLDLSGAKWGEAVFVLKNEATPPAEGGELRVLSLKLPLHDRVITFGSDGKRTAGVVPSNRAHLWLRDENGRVLNVPQAGEGAGTFSGTPTREGVFTVFHLVDGRYLAAFPLAGAASLAYFDFQPDKPPVLKVSSFGKAAVVGDLPLLSAAVSEDLYDACQKVWRATLDAGLPGITARLREDKSYPDYFHYLGWCTWEEYRSHISAKLLADSVKKIRASKVPVRWLLVDEGTQWHTADSEKDRMRVGKLRSFEPRSDHFPDGLKPVTALKDEAGIRWMGIWHHQGGFYRGIDRAAIADLPGAGKHLGKQRNGQLKPLPDYESQACFFDHLFKRSREAGFDFVKVDFQGPNFQGYIGGENAVAAHANANRALEDHCREHDLGLIHCFAQDSIVALNASHAPVIRVSQDYRSGKLTPARIQTYQCYNNKLWLGQVFWGDHDMFHSDDKVANRVMAVS